MNKGIIFSRNCSILFLNIYKYNFYKLIKRIELYSKVYDNRSVLYLGYNYFEKKIIVCWVNK